MFVYSTGSLHTGKQRMIKKKKKSRIQMGNPEPYAAIRTLPSEIIPCQEAH